MISDLEKLELKIENPFDKFANARKKHDILNRKVKGEDRDVGRARAKVTILQHPSFSRQSLK